MTQTELKELHLDILRDCKATASEVWDDGYKCGLANRLAATWVQDPKNPMRKVCSNCGATRVTYPNYCPRCGAKVIEMEIKEQV